MTKLLATIAFLGIGALAFAGNPAPAKEGCCGKDCACKAECCKDGKCTNKDCKCEKCAKCCK